MKPQKLAVFALAALGAACGPFAPRPEIPAELAGRWDVQQIAGASLGEGVDAFLQFNADRSEVSGFTGCNSFSAPLSTFGETIAVGVISEGDGECPTQAHATDEARLLGVLAHVQRYNRRGRSLELLEITPGSEALLLLRYADDQPVER